MKIKKGFTLIELLVVIVMIIIVSGVGIAAYSRLTNQKKIEGETKKISDVLQIAKQKASSVSYTEATLCSGTTPYVGGYRVNFSSSSYSIYVFCVDDINNPLLTASTPNPLNTYSLDSNVVIANASTPFDIKFNLLSKGATSKTIQIKNTVTNQYKCVSVNVLGAIEEITPCP